MAAETLRIELLVNTLQAQIWPNSDVIGHTNTTSISKISRVVQEGRCLRPDGISVEQIVVYYQAVEENPSLMTKSKIRNTDGQIEFITKTLCQILKSPRDEVYFFGSGHGAYLVRAVAGVLHHMGLPQEWSMIRFHENYLDALDLYKARCEEDSTHGMRLMRRLKTQCQDPPIIKFVGVFDTIKEKSDTTLHDVSFNPSTQIFRHALSINEGAADTVGVSITGSEHGRSLIQAWFMGYNDDLCGGVQHDGLSLYPLQWMLFESIRAGLLLEAQTNAAAEENPLRLIFPQYAGNVPQIDGIEPIEWRCIYKNGVKTSMFDLQSSHAAGNFKGKGSHTVRLLSESSFYHLPRRVFNAKGLCGWSPNGELFACDTFDVADHLEDSFSTIIHPSVYCLLDRYPRLQENARFRALKKDLADFQDQCMERPNDALPPWLEGMHLQANGVKAFRILVCGKTGVGKSTLINKVFGVEMVWTSVKRVWWALLTRRCQTEESNSYSQGVHDINQAFESPSHPGLLVHDSRGWQAGSSQELELIARFLRFRAFQKDSAEALHVIWFCVDSDVSRIEEADRKTFEIIAQYSHHVPIFIVGTKKDKITAFRKMQLLEQFLNTDSISDMKNANRLMTQEAEKHVKSQFSELISQLSQIKHYRADGYLTLSKGDDDGIKTLLNQTLGLIADERVRLFCVAAQVVSVDQKINAAVTETIRLGCHAVRTAMVPLPCSGIIGTPTVSRLLCEQILQCFGFPKAAPEAVEEIMSRVVLENLKRYMAVAMTQFLVVSGATVGVALATLGVGSVLGVGGCIFAAPPAARMLLKCACDMILILERSFRYGGKYVSVKQIEDAARYYVTTKITTFGGKELYLQRHVHEAVEKMVPLTSLSVGWRFAKLRFGLEEIIHGNRFEKSTILGRAELSNTNEICELDGRQLPVEIGDRASRAELEGDLAALQISSNDSDSHEFTSPTHTSASTGSPNMVDSAHEYGNFSIVQSPGIGQDDSVIPPSKWRQPSKSKLSARSLLGKKKPAK